jgi:hypothetical protein
MSTLGDLESRIYREVHTTLSTDVRNAVLEAVEYYKTERFWFNEAQVSFDVSLTSIYSLATIIPAMVNIDTIKIYQGSIPYVVSRSTWNKLDEIDTGTAATPTPTDYAIHHEMLRFYPTPNVTTSAVVTYHKAITMTASNTASSVWTNEAADLIRHRAKAYLYAGVLLDPAAAQVEQSMENQTLNRLFARTAKMTSSGKLKGWL